MTFRKPLLVNICTTIRNHLQCSSNLSQSNMTVPNKSRHAEILKLTRGPFS